MKKIWLTTAGIALAGATALATMPAQAFWGSWGGNGYPFFGAYPYAVAPAAVAPAASSAEK
jgi:hypothetical protein